MYNSKEERDQAIEKVVNDLSDICNTFSDKEVSDVFNKFMVRQHRTLQQTISRLVFRWIEFIASDEYNTDGRNQGSKETSQKVLKGFQQVVEQEHSHISGYKLDADSAKPSRWLGFI